MTEPTIQELVNKVVFCTGTGGTTKEFYAARAALLSRITQMETERDEWHKMADELAGGMVVPEAATQVRDWGMREVVSHKWIYRCSHCRQWAVEIRDITHSDDCPVTTYHALSLRYPHTSNETSEKGTEVK